MRTKECLKRLQRSLMHALIVMIIKSYFHFHFSSNRELMMCFGLPLAMLQNL